MNDLDLLEEKDLKIIQKKYSIIFQAEIYPVKLIFLVEEYI